MIQWQSLISPQILHKTNTYVHDLKILLSFSIKVVPRVFEKL